MSESKDIASVEEVAKWLRLGKLSIAERPEGETYVLESEAIAKLSALEKLEKDALRYRFLFDVRMPDIGVYRTGEYAEPYCKEWFDTAIDLARGQEK